ncbi:TetR/AcrR family transcriptional regulator [Dyadobacter sp. CY345]|uniref:TetR/AcrR family transcriptional regulator n=1 Tax=Dyadobacter sp. CY345 TaxID=2909335 RepID=UPI001F3CF731|nr:TetR/AcrR family transcriptional regulator [Dyadobacter sp. CY345]MCF2444133.1 TetR/AcrR family transcriptional regulator [Dyadobacter sp. CY345]
MPVIKVVPEDVDRKLTEVFTQYGYDGASMELLSKATGLKKASLYHRFPGGKKDMAAHVLKNTETWFQEQVGSLLHDQDREIGERLSEAIGKISLLFEDGARNCSLRMLSACSEAAYFQEIIASCFKILRDGFSFVARESGLSEREANERSMQAIINIQGSLVLSRAMGDNDIFKTSISAIPQLLGIQKK